MFASRVCDLLDNLTPCTWQKAHIKHLNSKKAPGLCKETEYVFPSGADISWIMHHNMAVSRHQVTRLCNKTKTD